MAVPYCLFAHSLLLVFELCLFICSLSAQTVIAAVVCLFGLYLRLRFRLTAALSVGVPGVPCRAADLPCELGVVRIR